MGRLGRIDGPSLASVGYLVPRTGKLPALVLLTARVSTLVRRHPGPGVRAPVCELNAPRADRAV